MAEGKVSHPVNEAAERDRGTLDAYRLLVMWLFICTLSAGIPFLTLVLYFDRTGRGGVTIMIRSWCSLRQLYGFEDIFPRRSYVRLFRKLDFYVIAYSLVPVPVGIIGAVMIYLLFAGGLVRATCSLISSVHRARVVTTSTALWSIGCRRMRRQMPRLVWGFVAGFSERFVPNILNHLATDKAK
jgi:hypothetical protein